MLRLTTLLAFTLLLLALVIPTRGAPLPLPQRSPSSDAVADALASRIAAIDKQIGKIPVIAAAPSAVRNPKMPKNPKHGSTRRRSLRLDSSNEEPFAAVEEELASPLADVEAEADPTIVPALLVPRGVSNPKASKTKTFVTSTRIKVTKPTNPAANPKHTYIPPSDVVGAPTTHPGEPHPPRGSVIDG
ncbi:hypothetical protein BCR35DRAFT_354612 [Leucosporidium creatinivorum]|uniref:Uncharacterized protein n=1 Tax=Leucosporidium creatinivorum TaxID=106004 RepID=A0A1Y2EDE6_9BASI|nr:hypothetical protein BCR35DRAFT_354612 [Leucosporidium creatinivorum]